MPNQRLLGVTSPLSSWFTVLLLLLLPVVPALIGSAHDSARALQLLSFPLITGLILLNGWQSGFSRRLLVDEAPGSLCLILLGALVVVTADRPEIALREWLLGLSLVCCGLFMGRSAQAAGQPLIEHRILPLLIGGATLYAALELVLLVAGIVQDQVLDYWQVFAGYSNPRFFNHAQTVLIPLLVGMLELSTLQGLWRRLAWFALIANAFFLLTLMGRATGLALVIGTLVASGLFGAQGHVFLRRLVLAFVGGALLYALIIRVLPTTLGMEELPAFRDLGERTSIESRLYLWGIALQDIAAHPWLGVGPMHYAHHFNGEAAHPHNIYLQLAAEYGLPFFALLAALVFRWLWRSTRRLRELMKRQPDPLALGCYVAIIGALVDGAFSGNFVMPLPQMWIVLTVALFQARVQPAPREPATPLPTTQSRISLAVWSLLLLGQLWLIAVSLPEFLQSAPRITGAPEAPATATRLNPRFWLDGWF